ncbi:MAG: tryptophan synthase subunit alpha [Nitrospiraceae bacterium]|nr:MAG: tryptophan synthase subunit alpha [Nitrospiraceae bacterium]
MSRITETFIRLKKTGRKALIPYIMSGDPSLDQTEKFIVDLERSGADIIELGVPFSDPLADGPTIQRAAEKSLAKGTTLKKVLASVRSIRNKTDIPLILMTYFNPVFKYGTERFVKDAADAGVDGVIIPDLIPDEAGDYLKLSRAKGLDTIFLLAPTSTEERITKVVKASTGFIYLVSITGITGSRLSVGSDMKKTLRAIRSMSNKPVAVGFGISTPADASAVATFADGVIVGSAIVKLIDRGKNIKHFVHNLRKAI